jgi:hypothetical protein
VILADAMDIFQNAVSRAGHMGLRWPIVSKSQKNVAFPDFNQNIGVILNSATHVAGCVEVLGVTTLKMKLVRRCMRVACE